MARAQSTDESLEDVRRIVGSFFEAWNNRDISKVVSVFSEDAEVVNSLGLWWSGLTDITRGLGAMNAIGPSLMPDSMSAHLVADDAALCVVGYTVASFTRVGGQVIPEQKEVALRHDTELMEFICNENNRDVGHLPGGSVR
jgi:uncharacterized protein (TIGR02246 family)